MGSMSSGLGSIIGFSLLAPWAMPTGPLGLNHVYAVWGILRARTSTVGSTHMSGSVHSVSITAPGLQKWSERSTASE